MAQGMKKCPFCGAEVKKTNFNRHLRKVHHELEEKEFEKEGIAKPAATKSKAKLEREEKKKTEIRKKVKNRQASRIAVIVVLIIIISVVGVIVYQNFVSNNNSGGSGVINNNGGGNPVAIMSTSLGTIKIELYEGNAPTTAGNFINLAKSGFYNGLVFHRVSPGFVIQGGGHLPDRTPKTASQIPWEDTGYKNLKYTIAMARSGDANSQEDSGTATSQFFINLKDNQNLDSYAYPYVVFGRVVDGYSVVDTIGNLPIGSDEWPNNPPVINSVIIQD